MNTNAENIETIIRNEYGPQYTQDDLELQRAAIDFKLAKTVQILPLGAI